MKLHSIQGESVDLPLFMLIVRCQDDNTLTFIFRFVRYRLQFFNATNE